MRSIVLIALVAIACSCSSKFSNAVKGEQKVIKPVYDINKDLLASVQVQDQSAAGVGRGGGILGTGVSLAVSGIKSLINADKKKYLAEYDAVLFEDYFYSNISIQPDGALDPSGIQFKGFTFVRMVKPDGKKIKADTAMYARFEVVTDGLSAQEIVNNSKFKLKMTDFKLNYAKVKVSSKQWYVPWTWFSPNPETLQIDFDIAIKATWFSKDGTFYDNTQIGRINFAVRDVPLDVAKQKAYLADPKSSPLKQGIGYCLLVPRSMSSIVKVSRGSTPAYESPSYGQGLYRIDMKVKETSKQSFAMKLFYDNSDMLIDSGSKLVPK